MGGCGGMGQKHGVGVGSGMGGQREIYVHGRDASSMGDSAVEKVSTDADRWDRLLVRDWAGHAGAG